MVASVCGGALFPPLLGLAGDNIGIQKAFFIPLIGVVVSWTYPLYLNVFKRKELDGYLEEDVDSSVTTKGDAESLSVEDDEKKMGHDSMVEIR